MTYPQDFNCKQSSFFYHCCKNMKKNIVWKKKLDEGFCVEWLIRRTRRPPSMWEENRWEIFCTHHSYNFNKKPDYNNFAGNFEKSSIFTQFKSWFFCSRSKDIPDFLRNAIVGYLNFSDVFGFAGIVSIYCNTHCHCLNNSSALCYFHNICLKQVLQERNGQYFLKD